MHVITHNVITYTYICYKCIKTPALSECNPCAYSRVWMAPHQTHSPVAPLPIRLCDNLGPAGGWCVGVGVGAGQGRAQKAHLLRRDLGLKRTSVMLLWQKIIREPHLSAKSPRKHGPVSTGVTAQDGGRVSVS